MTTQDNNPKVVDFAQRAPGAGERSEKPMDVLGQVRGHAMKRLTGLVTVLFENADDALFDLASKAENNALQASFFDGMREIRKRRQGMEAKFQERFQRHFADFQAGRSTATAKRFRAGMDQLVREGVIQLFETAGGSASLLGAVGPLQFEVLKYRLESEYGAEVIVEHCPWQAIRWLMKDDEPVTGAFPPTDDLPGGCALAKDAAGHWVVLAEAEWALRSFKRYHEQWELADRLVK